MKISKLLSALLSTILGLVGFLYVGESIETVEKNKPTKKVSKNQKEILRCTKCILKNSVKGIYFDENGVCNVCKHHVPITYEGEEKLLEKLENVKSSKKGEFDCIVTLSGGRDSSFVLLKAVKDYNLKVLGVHYENPFETSLAKENVEKITKKLNVPLINIKEPSNLHLKMFKKNFKVWIRKPSVNVLPIFCIGCKYMWYYIMKIAKKYKVGCVLSGGNRFENTVFKKLLLDIPMNEKWETTYIKSLWGGIKEIIKNPLYILNGPIKYIFAYLFGDSYSIGNRLIYPDIEKIDLFYYLKYDEKIVISRLEEELGWRYPKELSSWRFDCKISYLKTYIYNKVIGMTERDDLFSVMIREGVLSREEALERIEKENQVPDEIIDELLSISNVSKKDFEKSLNSLLKEEKT